MNEANSLARLVDRHVVRPRGQPDGSAGREPHPHEALGPGWGSGGGQDDDAGGETVASRTP